ncbi:MAG: DUF2497 domain-containing protein [Hyphomicrobiaceae bacterium]
MSRDSSGESLEAILASIRRSLAEQTTSVLQEEAVMPAELLPPADGIADLDTPPIPASLSQRLALAPDARQGAQIGLGEEAAPMAEDPPAAAAAVVPQARDLSLPPAPTPAPAPVAAPGPEGGSDPGVVPAPNGGMAPAAAPGQSADPAAGQKDPLWFLSQEPRPQAARPTGSGPPQNALLNGARAAPASEPKPSRLGAVRGPLPPFFGSSAEVVKETAPDPPELSGRLAQPLTPSSYPAPPPPAQPLDGVRTVNGEARDLDAAPRPADGTGTARASSIFGPPPADAGTGGSGEALPPQIQALDAMVAELLRPMLRRWLDENMPRLVSAALKAEAELMSRRDPKKP